MKISRTAYNMIIRFIAGLAASLILVGCVEILSERMAVNRPQKIAEEMASQSLLYKASGINQDAVVMTVDGEPVTAAEYLFWMTYLGNEMSYYYEISDFSTLMSETVTAGDYVKTLANDYVTSYAVVRQWASELGISLTEADYAEMEADRQQAIASYGSEEAYNEQLSLLGYTEDLLYNVILPYSMLRSHITEEYTSADGSLHPSNSDLRTYANSNSLRAGKYLNVCAEDYASPAEAEAALNTYLETLKNSENPEETWNAIASELSLETESVLFDVSGSNPLSSALASLEVGQFSDVVAYEDDYFILQVCEYDYHQLAESKFEYDLEQRCAGATIVYNDLYQQLDMTTYYPSFLEAQSELLAAISARATAETSSAD